MNFFYNIDLSLFSLMNGKWVCPFLDRFMVLATNQETGILIIIGILVGITIIGRKKGRITALSALVGYAIIDPLGHYVIKPLIAKPRPCHLDLGRLLVDCGTGYAMPSLHAAASFGVFSVIVTHYGWPATPLYFLALIVAYSRVYVGVHWPMDIFAGAIYGAFIGVGISLLAKKLFKMEKNNAHAT
ncbi:phosphatase PAP2 family protein [bacterium]|nr:phosphatase PAP2 family protein [bacterium]